MAVIDVPEQKQPLKLVFRPGAGPAGDTLVLLLLRGGMDGLHTVPPHADPDFSGIRNKLALPPPDRRGGIIDLDGFYGLHSELAPLANLYCDRTLAIVHACGSPDQTLSHFEASKTLERGVSDGNTIGSGWLSRHLNTCNTGNKSLLRAIAFSKVMPAALTGAPHAVAIPSISEFRLEVSAGWESGFNRGLKELYGDTGDPALDAGRDTLQLLVDLKKLQSSQYRPQGGAVYPKDPLGGNLRELAQLIRAEIGVEAAVVELGGWDTHLGQLPQMSSLMTSLSGALYAFVRDLGDRMRNVVVVAISEFGRRISENSAQGTDHGRGTAMFVLGGGVRGGHVYGRWPGLHPEQRDRDGNLQVTTDYRHILAEIVERRLRNRRTAQVFPDFTPGYLNLTR